MYLRTDQTPEAEVTLSPARQLLMGGAAYIEKHGLRKGGFGGGGGSACALGAILEVSGTNEKDLSIGAIFGSDMVDAASILGSYLNSQGKGDALLITGWNDDKHTTAAEVIGTMRAAAYAGL